MSVVRLLLGVVVTATAFAAFTWWVLESDGIAILETRTPENSTRSTHVWYATQGDELWLEAGTPENGWFRDIQVNRELTLTVDGRSQQYLAEAIHDPSGHGAIRSLLRQKYGFRDWWVALIFDTSRSIAVRLRTAPHQP